MFYRWAKRLEAMQLPATAFPTARGDPAVETEDSFELDGALIAGAIASMWVLIYSGGSKWFAGPDSIAVIYGPIFLVVLLGGLLLRRPTSRAAIAVNLGAYFGVAVVMSLSWAFSGQHLAIAIPGVEVIVWAAFFAMFGLVSTVLCLLAWTATLRWLAAPGSLLREFGPFVRGLCIFVILAAAFIGAHRALTTLVVQL